MGGDPVPIPYDKLRERFEKAEGQIKRDNYREQPKKKWLRTKCSHCGYEIDYSPKDDFDGDLRCPTCGKNFHISRMDDFIEP